MKLVKARAFDFSGRIITAGICGSLIATAVALLHQPPAYAAPACDTEIVDAPAGPVCGLTRQLGDQAAEVFLGIAFGKDTSGQARFRPAQAVDDWTQTFQGTSFGDICAQPLLPEADISAMSENCLNLNVWRPKGTKAGSDLAVMVFIYGGAFLMGDNQYGLYDGAHLAAHRNVIVVNLNYRLGSFGFLVSDDVSGNMGITDQQLALRWVARNIRAFGGDPGKVTLFGESAGAMSIGLHTFSIPSSEPLFRAAIMESNVLGLPYKTPQQQAYISDLLLAVSGCSNISCLRDLPMTRLVELQTRAYLLSKRVFLGVAHFVPFGPVIDGKLIVNSPLRAIDQNRFKPILLGSNRNDAKLFVGDGPMSSSDMIVYSANTFGGAFRSILDRYPPSDSAANLKAWTEIETRYLLQCPTQLMAKSVSSAAYLYEFDHTPSFPVWGGGRCERKGVVCHGAELPFVFHTAREIGGQFTEQEEYLSDHVMAYWTNFAKYLDPNGPGSSEAQSPVDLVRWPRANMGDSAMTLRLQTPVSVAVRGANDGNCTFWDSIGYGRGNPWENKASSER